MNFRAARDLPSTALLRRNHHIGGIFDPAGEEEVEDAIALMRSLAWERNTVLMGIHPPVLLIPEVFSRNDCSVSSRFSRKKRHAFVDPQLAVDLMNGSDYKMRIP